MPSRTAARTRIGSLAVVPMLVGAACGGGADGPADDQGASDEPAVLELRVTGTLEQGLLCPGGRRPCLTFEGELEPVDGFVQTVGWLIDGVFVVDEQLPPPESSSRTYDNQCPGRDLGAPPDELLEAIYEGGPSGLPDGFVDAWDSDDGTFHIGVFGDPAATERWLEDRGAGGTVCVVSGYPHSDEVLESVQAQVGQAARDAGFDNWSSSRDSWIGTVTLYVPRFGEEFRARLDDISEASGVDVQVDAAVEVLNGSVVDYEATIAGLAVSPDPALAARCGQVTFSDLPPDLDEFPPLDEDAQSALDELFNGPTGVEAGFVADVDTWSIAERTDSELVLFGRPAAGSEGYVSASFDERGGEWRLTSWGGCQIFIEAPGLGPATVGFDPAAPPLPADTTLELLINERACASGQPPTDREVVVRATESADTVTIVALVAPVEGGAECPSNPWFPVEVELDEPLGDRQLLDGVQFPPIPVGAADE